MSPALPGGHQPGRNGGLRGLEQDALPLHLNTGRGLDGRRHSQNWLELGLEVVELGEALAVLGLEGAPGDQPRLLRAVQAVGQLGVAIQGRAVVR